MVENLNSAIWTTYIPTHHPFLLVKEINPDHLPGNETKYLDLHTTYAQLTVLCTSSLIAIFKSHITVSAAKYYRSNP